MKESIARLEAYIARRKLARGLHIDDIHGFDAGPDSGTDLRLSDIEAVLPALGAVRDVLAERKRQIEVEGWTPASDDEYTFGELRVAAACYVTGDTKGGWPWDKAWWKPTDDRRDLIKAAALILAEIERLDRAALVAAVEPEVKP